VTTIKDLFNFVIYESE